MKKEKITLHTLAEATLQEIFDQVKDHLLTQNQKAVNPNTADCMYRTSEGLKCAVGCLISDEEYNPTFEGVASIGLLQYDTILSNQYSKSIIQSYIPIELDGIKIDFIQSLQAIHDGGDPSEWISRLKSFAEYNNLNY
jgi:hypothetical protein